MKVDNKFSPYLAQVAKPTGQNALTILGAGLTQYDKDQKANALGDLKMEQYRDKVADSKMLAKYKQHLDEGGNKRTFLEAGNTFLTDEGAMGAESLDKSRAQQRIAEGRYGLSVRRASRPKVRKKKTSTATVSPSSSLDTLNASLQGNKAPATTTPQRAIVRTGMKNGKRVVQYSDGSVEYGN